MAETSIAYDNESRWLRCLADTGQNTAIMNPTILPRGLLFRSGGFVQANISRAYPSPAADPATEPTPQHDLAHILTRSDGSALAFAVAVDGGDVYGPVAGRSPPIDFMTHGETETSSTTNTPVAMQETLRQVLTLPNGMAVGFNNTAGFRCSAIDGGDMATLVPEHAAGHTIYCIGFTKGWKGRGCRGQGERRAHFARTHLLNCAPVGPNGASETAPNPI
jgi:hypothetical protein